MVNVVSFGIYSGCLATLVGGVEVISGVVEVAFEGKANCEKSCVLDTGKVSDIAGCVVVSVGYFTGSLTAALTGISGITGVELIGYESV